MIKGIDASLLYLTPAQLKNMGEVTKTNILDGNKLDQDGLYSTAIFGNLNTETRLNTPGYIDLHIKIVIPIVWDYFLSLSNVHVKVAKGLARGIIKDGELVITTDQSKGGTGMGYIYSIIDKLKFKSTGSQTRQDKIDTINNEFKAGRGWITKLLVIPAGLRDITFDENERPVEQEINDLYRRMIVLSKASLTVTNKHVLDGEVDIIVRKLQDGVQAIYEFSALGAADGKYKFLRTKWTSRKITGATRNVITGQKTSIRNLRDIELVTNLNNMQLGVYQYVFAYLPLIIRELNKHIANIVQGGKFLLISGNRYKEVKVTGKEADYWLEQDGIVKILHRVKNNFNKPIMIGKYPVFAYDIIDDEIHIIPTSGEITSASKIFTYGEFFTLLCNNVVDEVAAIATRHPTTGKGSTIPVLPIINPGINNHVITYRGKRINFPKPNTLPFMSMHVAYERLGALGGDHDGDKMPFIGLMSKEAVAEIKELLSSRRYYISGNGDFDAVMSYDSLNDLVTSLTHTGD